MTNVLPIPAQKALWGIHRARFLIILSIALIALALFMLLALAPSFAALEVNTMSAEEVTAQAGTVAEDLKNMKRSQLLLGAVGPVISSTSSPSTAIAKAVSLRPKGLTVLNIRYVGSSKTILLGGLGSREQLTAYRTALENDGTFTTVSVPVAALVGTSGQFSITLGGNF